jgi:hypothetical protein
MFGLDRSAIAGKILFRSFELQSSSQGCSECSSRILSLCRCWEVSASREKDRCISCSSSSSPSRSTKTTIVPFIDAVRRSLARRAKQKMGSLLRWTACRIYERHFLCPTNYEGRSSSCSVPRLPLKLNMAIWGLN